MIPRIQALLECWGLGTYVRPLPNGLWRVRVTRNHVALVDEECEYEDIAKTLEYAYDLYGDYLESSL